MKTILRDPFRIGLLLSTLAALLAFAARAALAQEPVTQTLSLGEAVRLAATQGSAVQEARYRVNAAEARVRQARSALLPNITANATESGRTFNSASFGISFPAAPGQKPLFDPNGSIVGPVYGTDLRATARMSLLDPAAYARVRAAQAAVGATDADRASIAQQTATAAAQAYLRALRSDAQLSARLADSSLAADLVGIAQQQLRAGVGIGLDVTRAQAQLATTRTQLIVARNERDRARLDLLRVLDLPLNTTLVLSDSLTRGALPISTEEQGAVDVAMRSRPDLRAAAEQIAAAERQLQATRAERFPTVGAFGDDGWYGKNPKYLLPTYSWGLQISVPVFTGFQREGRIEEQQFQTHELEVRRRDLEQQVAVDVRGAILDITAARQGVDAARERVQLAEQEVAQARERFSAGVAGNADVITAALNLTQARTQYIDALAAYQNSQVALARAEGTIIQIP